MYRNLDFSSLPNEIWKKIENVDGDYEVSNFGRIRSLDCFIVEKNGKRKSKKQKIMKQSFTSTGYLMVNLERKMCKVHRLVAYAFIPNLENKPHINHKDGNTLNNNVDNLEWVTPKENVDHAIKTGLTIRIKDLLDKDLIIENYTDDETIKTLAKKFNTTYCVVRGILKSENIKIHSKPSMFNINLETLKKEFDLKIPNKELAKKYNCSQNLIARRKYQYKKGEI